MRALYRAAAVSAFTLLSFVGPVSAATMPAVIAQQPPASQATITGKITDSRGNGLGGATITASGPTTRSATTAADGTYSIVLPPGVYIVLASHGGYQQSQSDPIAIVAGTTATANATLSEQNLQSLRVIGRTGTSAAARNGFNVSESADSQLPPIEIAIRNQANLTDTVAELPGVLATRSFSATPNTSFAVRGASLQTRVTVDGHPISSGIAGTWNTNYANSLIFQDVEVVKGAGLNGSIAGESAVGSVNLRTRDFTSNNSSGAQLGGDSYNGGYYNAFVDFNLLKDKKLSIILQKAYSGFNGPWDATNQARVGTSNITSQVPSTGVAPSFSGLDQWTGDFSNRYALEAELAKLRYRFSESSSVTFEYLGLQGQYTPQGGAYASYYGTMTLKACQNGTAYQATLATCTASSLYTAPYTFNKIGSIQNGYTWFPNSYIQNNEPQFAAEFRTSIKNDTLLIRPYTHLINRYISGVNENHYPGNGGGWYAVTSNANCQALFLKPGAAGGPASGAAGPCFPVTTGPNDPAYIGGAATPVQFKTTPNAPTCSPTPPYTCFTTPTGLQNDGTIGFSSPFSQPELDRLNGYTISYVHPVGDNVYNASVDYRKDFAQSRSSDTSAAAPGCQFVVGSATGANTYYTMTTSGVKTYVPYQPGCSTAQYATLTPGSTLTTAPANSVATPYATYNLLPRSSIGTPPTVSQYSDFALTGTFQLAPKLRLAIGNYFEIYKLNAQIENPAVLAHYSQPCPTTLTVSCVGSAAAAPVDLVQRGQTYNHYDPHAGLEFRATRDLSLRANAGSSITQPYPSIVSGFGSITIPNAAQPNYVNSIPNFDLKPETTVSYDVGLDQRLVDGGVLSADLYDITVHNVFLSNTSNLGSISGVCGPGQNAAFPTASCLQTNYINGPIQRGYGLEVSATKNPVQGFGYYLSGTLSRTYLDQLPLSIYFSNNSATNGNFNVNNAQLFGFPFFKAYGQLLYNDRRGNTFAFGADYEGSNNYTFGQGYTVYDAAVRIPIIPHRLRLEVSGQNIFNLNTGALLGRALYNQGNVEPTVWLPTGTTTLKPGNSAAYNRNGTTQINAINPRNIRFGLDYAM